MPRPKESSLTVPLDMCRHAAVRVPQISVRYYVRVDSDGQECVA